jgi:nickel/cobalt exporter
LTPKSFGKGLICPQADDQENGSTHLHSETGRGGQESFRMIAPQRNYGNTMENRETLSICKHSALAAFSLIIVIFVSGAAFGHPLGNFTINHFTRVEVGNNQVKLHGVIDMAEIPTFQELQKIDTDGDGKASGTELNEYLDGAAGQWADRMILTVNGARVPLRVVAKNASLLPGAGGLETLRVELDLVGQFSEIRATETGNLQFEDANYPDRIGWREIVAAPLSGVTIFNSSAFGNGLSDELKSYPAGMLAAPLAERKAELSFSRGPLPAGVRPLMSRDGRPAQTLARDRLAELIAVPHLTPGLALLGFLFAIVLGGVHALAPGHGKTVVGAYLVGSRGTARHAAFLGLTVTLTHTAGVFALGVVTLLASEYVLPEKLFPALSFVSGAIVMGLGLTLLIRRLRKAGGWGSHNHTHIHDGYSHSHTHGKTLAHDHIRGTDPAERHSHGGQTHSHLPPGADGSPVTWRSLLALGISGGILPCPSALVVLLAAISLHRVGYGLLLVVAFSFGLAGALTIVGLAFVYAGRLVKANGKLGRLARVLPIFSAFVIACAGAAICYEALNQAGLNLFQFVSELTLRLGAATANAEPSFISMGALGVLGIGLVYGLKHATEADHIVAVSAIVSEHRKLVPAAFVGGLWGAGHTASLLIVGVFVLALRIAIPEHVASWLEFAVALMIIGLGIMAFRRALWSRSDFHIHKHGHHNLSHAHIHFHEEGSRQINPVQPHSHTVARIGLKPVLVGAVHGLAGSGALTLLVLTQIKSSLLGLIYLGVFGVGSIIGMLLMSGLVGLPFVFSSRKLNGIHYGLQMLAGALSITFGLWYAYEIGIGGGLLRVHSGGYSTI